jgi:hypothetical protein
MAAFTPFASIHPITFTLCMCALLWPWTAHAQEVYRCGNSYSTEPCAGGKAISTQPLVEVHRPAQSRNDSHIQQRNEARERDRTERELDKAEFKSAPQRSTNNRQQCQSKQQRIAKIDDLARKGGNAKRMEQLREERQQARDWMFRAGC